MIDLAVEFTAAVRAVDSQWVDRLLDDGVPLEALLTTPRICGVSSIETYTGGFFEFRDHGAKAVILPVGEPIGDDWADWDLDDLVAFFLDRPSRWWRRTGDSQVLGEFNFHRFQVDRLRLHPHPLYWLRDRGRGVCLLDWSQDPLDVLLGAGPLTANTSLKTRVRNRAQEVALARANRIFSHA